MRGIAKVHTGRRFEGHQIGHGDPLELAATHPAVVLEQTLFHARVVHPMLQDRILKSGQNSKKIGGRITKGKWKGFPVFTLTLQERATCPRDCLHYRDCYGNTMNWAQRFIHGPDLERLLERELRDLDREHPGGFAVRLHVLGDFYSVKYVERWEDWLDRFSALHCFGFTAWGIGTPIGEAVERARFNWSRFAIRTSDGGQAECCTVSIFKTSDEVAKLNIRGSQPDGSIVCPAQTGDTSSCSDCGLCWQTRRNIAFLVH